MAKKESKKRAINVEWFKKVLKRQHASVISLGKERGGTKWTERTIRQSLQDGEMSPGLLNAIAKEIDVHPDYLAGKYCWTRELPIMNEPGVREYWDEHFLCPANYPYILFEQAKVGSHQHLVNTLIIHGISDAAFKNLDTETRQKIESSIDQATTELLHRWFPKAESASLTDYYLAMEWQDERDVIEAMLDYLEEQGLVEVYVPEPDENYVSPFEEKYKYLPIVSMPTMERIVIKGESGFCNVDEAYTDVVTITPDWIRYQYEPREMSEHNLPTSWAYQPSGLGHRALFDEVAEMVAGILEKDDEEFVTDIGSTTFAVTYPNGTKKHRDFRLPSGDFSECFSLVKKMIPREEKVPRVLMTSDDE